MQFLIVGAVWGLQGCAFVETKTASSLNFSGRASESCGLRLVYQPGCSTVANWLGNLAFGHTEWLEYTIDDRLVARHAAYEGMNVVAYLDPGEHALQVFAADSGLLTLGSTSKRLTAKFCFTVFDGQVGTFRVKTVPGEYVPELAFGGFEDIWSWARIQ